MANDPDDIFAFVNQILFRSSSPPQQTEPRFSMAGPSGGGFPSSMGHFPSVENEPDQYDCESEEGSEAMLEELSAAKSRVPRNTKRSRAAEFHNLSEKRRRSRINEKMKALQNLIPNSNKTDKASMLDEAIEYLKQLQLQVQMLTMRNGLSRYPMCLNGVPQNQYPTVAVGSYGRNRSPNPNMTGPVHMNHDVSLNGMRSVAINGPNTKLTSVATYSNVVSSEATSDMETMQPHLPPSQQPISLKENCRAGILFSDDMDGCHSRNMSIGEASTSIPFVPELSGLRSGSFESYHPTRNQSDAYHPTHMDCTTPQLYK
ncbi:unnamed protein product [Cuscuta epithymum]|uniref:BHLH domain-containing protein n=1 Tax=Cuscuta epithymum TaxID=186058 RepID=A0AAV0D1Q8_9ASTE|nr:unnamed protein product [Cuscuta epithymum]CAH9124636.1 unnamed protein product [Cuscuta epithymum]